MADWATTAMQRLLPVGSARRTPADCHQAVVRPCHRWPRECRRHEIQRALSSGLVPRAARPTASFWAEHARPTHCSPRARADGRCCGHDESATSVRFGGVCLARNRSGIATFSARDNPWNQIALDRQRAMRRWRTSSLRPCSRANGSQGSRRRLLPTGCLQPPPNFEVHRCPGSRSPRCLRPTAVRRRQVCPS